MLVLAAGLLWWQLSRPADDSPAASGPAETTQLYFLDRADPLVGGLDQIRRLELGDALPEGGADAVIAEGELVYSGERILDFVVVGTSLAVLSEDSQRLSQLAVVDSGDGSVSAVPLPSPGAVDQLRADAGSQHFGFRFTPAADPASPDAPTAEPQQPTHELLVVDAAASLEPRAVEAEDGSPISASNWFFLPGASPAASTGSQPPGILVLDAHEELLRIAGGSVQELGEFHGLVSVSADGRTAIVRDEVDTILLLLDGDADVPERPFGPSPLDGVLPLGGAVELVINGPERVQKVLLIDEETGRATTVVVRDDGTSSSLLYAGPGESSGIDDMTVSPDGRFVAVEVVPDVSQMVSDAYYPFDRASSVMTVIVDRESARVVATLAGFSVAW